MTHLQAGVIVVEVGIMAVAYLLGGFGTWRGRGPRV